MKDSDGRDDLKYAIDACQAAVRDLLNWPRQLLAEATIVDLKRLRR